MQTNYLSIFFLITFLDFSVQENTNEIKNQNIGIKDINDFKDLNKKEEYDLNEVDSLLNNMTEIYENRLSNLSETINQLLDFKEMINRKQEENQIINGMINEIKLLKKEYKRNFNLTFILFGLFICINIIFAIYDCINKNKIKATSNGYRRAYEEQYYNQNNQISIE